MNGYGSVPIYSTSRSIDLQNIETIYSEQNIFNQFPSCTDFNTTNITHSITTHHHPLHYLLIGTADISTILKTIARSRRYPSRNIHFHIIESQIPIIAKHILLFYIALHPQLNHLSLLERSQLFLELYGSIHIRDKTHDWLSNTVNSLIRIVTDKDTFLNSVITFNRFRYRDYDDLESAFKFWKSSIPFPIDKFWDNRCRKYYGIRYDSKENVIDWDYHMRLYDQCKQLSKSEYQHWRITGQAFPIRDSIASHPNRTMATVSTVQDPRHKSNSLKWGYFSDIVTGPFVTWGTDTEYHDLLKLINDQPSHTSTDISLHNIVHTLTELYYGRPDGGQPILPDIIQLLNQFTIHIYSPTLSLNQFIDKPILDNNTGKLIIYDAIIIGSSLAHWCERINGSTILKPNGNLLVETLKWNLDFNVEQQGQYCKKITDMIINNDMELSKLQRNKLKECDGKWDKLGNRWDYLAYHKKILTTPE